MLNSISICKANYNKTKTKTTLTQIMVVYSQDSTKTIKCSSLKIKTYIPNKDFKVCKTIATITLIKVRATLIIMDLISQMNTNTCKIPIKIELKKIIIIIQMFSTQTKTMDMITIRWEITTIITSINKTISSNKNGIMMAMPIKTITVMATLKIINIIDKDLFN